MLGWNIGVYRQTDGGGASPATFDSPYGARIAVWQTGISGLNWLNQLVAKHQAICLGGNGYPLRYTATADQILPRISEGPPDANDIWMSAVGDIIGRGWAGKTVIDSRVASLCREQEWLLIEVWDES